MSKFMLLTGAALALLAGQAAAVEAASAPRSMHAAEASLTADDFAGHPFPGQKFGPWTLEFARGKMLDWMQNHGINCHLEPAGISKWYVVID